MIPLKLAIIVLSDLTCIVSIIAHIIIKIRMKTHLKATFDDETYYEFEESHPVFAKYEKWSQVSFACAVISALALFVTSFIL